MALATRRAAARKSPGTQRTQTTRNYELDRTISHTKPSLGTIRRLSVAVVVRSPATSDAEDAAPAGASGDPATSTVGGFSAAQIEKMTQLVKEAIGFDPTRGDTVSVSATTFQAPPPPAALPEHTNMATGMGMGRSPSRY